MTQVDRTPLAVVTGAGGALAGAVVAELMARGLGVVGVDRSEAAMSGLPSEVGREVVDLTAAEEVDALFDRITVDGTVDAVVHTVGAYRDGAVADSDPDAYRLMMDVNLHAAWWVSRAAARRMRAARGGSIVHVGSRHGSEPVAGAGAYSVSKAGLLQLTRVLDAELREHGVRVNAVVPGLIDTPANRASMPATAMAHAVAPQAIAKVIGFLVSDEAAPVVGAIVPVYGAG